MGQLLRGCLGDAVPTTPIDIFAAVSLAANLKDKNASEDPAKDSDPLAKYGNFTLVLGCF